MSQALLLHLAERALVDAWITANRDCFDDALRQPMIEIAELGRRLGSWDQRSRCLRLDRGLVLEQPWGVVREVLKHEMAHQYCHEILGLTDEQHGAVFGRICAERGIDARAAGLPAAGSADEAAPAAVLQRIQKLLALAESPELHEAEAAMAKATRLMREFNVEMVKLDEQRRFTTRQLGAVHARMPLFMNLLGGLLGEHFFVFAIRVSGHDVLRGEAGRAIEVTGTPENVEMAHYVYDFLLGLGDRLWQRAQAQRGLRGERERQRFLAGMISGFGAKLRAERGRSEEEGLIWVGDPRLDAWIDQRYPRVRSGSRASVARTQAWDAGHEEGSRIVLHKPITTQAASGRALTDGRA